MSLEQNINDVFEADDEEVIIGADEDDETEEEEDAVGGRVPIELDDALSAADLQALFSGKKSRAKSGGRAAPHMPSATPNQVAAAYAAQSGNASVPKPRPVVPDTVPVSDAPDEVSPIEPLEGDVLQAIDPARETELLAEIETTTNNYKRALADLQNYRRRADDEIKKIKAHAAERLIKEILPVVDDFDRSLNAAKQSESYEQLVAGVEAVFRKFNDVLLREGVEQIPALGEHFNPDVHEAIMVEEGSDAPDESVVEELRKGYTLHGRVIRPSLVKVAKS
jgi:molecular chaperone GrpE